MRPTRALFVSASGRPISAALAPAQDKTAPVEKLTAFAATMQSGRTGVIQITLNRWSTDEERETRLVAASRRAESRSCSTP